ncbi:MULTISPECIES: RidA family protein [Geobacter]|uniref:Endoribonuclease L-PSP n=2 Tax=Geobacter TaxID=28231 RepID=A0A0C1QUC6_9BACT|nr:MULTISPECIES: RidA family protein [Geobacter]ANA39971.1 reactive intermediate/imine deaminase [Geobacter anodireducens]KIE41821.1 endoribonuclease L-PSP [Geobacter soli]MBE2887958.1 RidA family protein [Geobacter anodireducens]HMN01436.1 RidA family protein [Geobacter anodireducens]
MKEIIATEQAPRAIGPYSQAVRAGGFLFLSGQIPLDPATGEMVDGDITVQTTRVMDNMAAVLAEAGLGFDAIVKTTIFLADLADFAAVNQAYGSRFAAAPPARSTVEVKGLPRGALVEIEAIAFCR